jgi:hypothetical protein
MSRPPAPRLASVVLLAGITLGAAACGGGPSLPALTDPTEILTAALASTEGARTVHADVTVDGSVEADLFGTGSSGQSLELKGTPAAADVDMAGGKARATFKVPPIFNLSGELIQIGETSYLKTSLTGPLYEEQQATDSLPVDPTNASGMFDGLRDLLTAEGVDPVKGDDVSCGGKQCYAVTMALSPDELTALGVDPAALAGDLPIELGAASLDLTVRIEKDTRRLAGIAALISFEAQGSLTVDASFSRWDEPMDISAPPADQIGTGS